MTTHLYVFAYDVRKDSQRERLADLLAEDLRRVQKSVFEGRLTPAAAKRLVRRASNYIGADDSLRVYAVTREGLAASSALGNGAPLAEAEDFMLF